MKAMGQTVPYAQFQADVTNLPVKTLRGIIAVAQDNEGKSKILVSANEQGKYSQIIAEQFFKKVKLSESSASTKEKSKNKDTEKEKATTEDTLKDKAVAQTKQKLEEAAQKAKEIAQEKIKTEKNDK